MGRAERRRAERANRIEERKSKILLTRKELTDIKHDAQDAIAKASVENLMTCFALVLAEKYNFDVDQIVDCLSSIDSYMGMINDDEITMDDLIAKLEDHGLRIEMD